MNYIIADKSKAVNYGFQIETHLCNGDMMCINEKELMNSVCMSGNLIERADKLSGVVCDQYEALEFMNNK
ncbi:MAG: hypothetical protein HDR88_10645 [Bacteroides sp.]|nr:hypothetical protein [Bacteroides sp.]